MDISDRQKKLLKAIIQEFIDTAGAVSSLNLPEKYDLPISSATIRNEMKSLSDAGYLKQLHTSSGRVPTTIGMRFFIQELINHLEDLEVLAQEKIRHSIHENRFNRERLIRTAIDELNRITSHPTLMLTANEVHYSGLSNMLDMPEFQEIQDLQRFMRIIEDFPTLKRIFEKSITDNRVKIIIGEEMGIDQLDSYSMVFSKVTLFQKEQAYIAVFGPIRMDYARIIPATENVAIAINRATSGW